MTPPEITAYPVCVEVDFYGREDDGSRYHVRSARVELAGPEALERLPFLLTAQVGPHHGIKRIKVVPHAA